MADQRPSRHLLLLPPELIDNIFAHFGVLQDVYHFAATCRYLYQRFAGRRVRIIWQCLKNHLGHILIDSRALYLFRYSQPYSGRAMNDAVTERQLIHRTAARYHAMRQAGLERLPIPSMTELTRLCHTLYKIHFLVRTYLTTRGRSDDIYKMSEEMDLLVSSFYRLQIIAIIVTWATLPPMISSTPDTSRYSLFKLNPISTFTNREMWPILVVQFFITTQFHELETKADNGDSRKRRRLDRSPPRDFVQQRRLEAPLAVFYTHLDMDYLAESIRANPRDFTEYTNYEEMLQASTIKTIQYLRSILI